MPARIDRPTMNQTKTQRIVVYVDDEPRRFFRGLRVRHAIGYRASWYVEMDRAAVEDRHGNLMDLDGALFEGERLYIRPK
jgi:hypothetical protein